MIDPVTNATLWVLWGKVAEPQPSRCREPSGTSDPARLAGPTRCARHCLVNVRDAR